MNIDKRENEIPDKKMNIMGEKIRTLEKLENKKILQGSDLIPNNSCFANMENLI